MPPGTLLRDFRARWAAGKGHLTRFCGDSVSGGRRKRTPGTLLRGYRARWEAEKDTWYTFAWIPCQVGGGKGHLVHFCVDTVIPCQVGGGKGHLTRFRGNSVPGGRREETPGTLSQENRGRWEARKDTCNAFAGIPCQVGTHRYMSAGTYCGAPPGLPAMRAPSLLGSRCRLRPLYVPVIPHDTAPDVLT